MNKEKSKVASVYSSRNIKFLGFALGKGKDGVWFIIIISDTLCQIIMNTQHFLFQIRTRILCIM